MMSTIALFSLRFDLMFSYDTKRNIYSTLKSLSTALNRK